MKLLFSIATLLTAWTGFSQGTTEAIFSYDKSISGGPFDGAAGWTFQMNSNERALYLGCFAKVFDIYPTASIQVGLWSDSGSLLASSVITSSSPLENATRYESITPVALDPGQIYHLGAYYGGALNGFYLDVAGAAAGGSISNSPAIQLRGAASALSGFSFPAEETGALGSIYAGPNFRYGIPEPSSGLLVVLGGLLLAARRNVRRC
jgi:hypothetical protein